MGRDYWNMHFPWEHSLCKKREEMPFLEKFSEVVVVTSSRLVPPGAWEWRGCFRRRGGLRAAHGRSEFLGVIEGAGRWT